MMPIQIAFRRSDSVIDRGTMFGARTAYTALTAVPRAPHFAPLDLFNVNRVPYFPSYVVQFLNLVGGHDLYLLGFMQINFTAPAVNKLSAPLFAS
jgi:hypothetical protein